MKLPEDVRINGVLISYFVKCKRETWLFSKGLGLEKESQLVQLGRLVSESTYKRQEHEINLDNKIVLDWYDKKNRIIHEVKKSPALEYSHIWQVKYYIFYLEQKGIHGVKGIINYPLHKKMTYVSFEESDKETLSQLFQEIKALLNQPKPPPPERKPFCKACSYYELCWI